MKHTYRQPDHARSNRLHVNGRVLPMQEQDWNIWRLIWKRQERAR